MKKKVYAVEIEQKRRWTATVYVAAESLVIAKAQAKDNKELLGDTAFQQGLWEEDFEYSSPTDISEIEEIEDMEENEAHVTLSS